MTAVNGGELRTGNGGEHRIDDDLLTRLVDVESKFQLVGIVDQLVQLLEGILCHAASRLRVFPSLLCHRLLEALTDLRRQHLSHRWWHLLHLQANGDVVIVAESFEHRHRIGRGQAEHVAIRRQHGPVASLADVDGAGAQGDDQRSIVEFVGRAGLCFEPLQDSLHVIGRNDCHRLRHAIDQRNQDSDRLGRIDSLCEGTGHHREDATRLGLADDTGQVVHVLH